MADSSVNVSNPVRIESDNKARVAFDLMEKIARFENRNDTGDRDYWLKLYVQCNAAVHDYSIDSILKRI